MNSESQRLLVNTIEDEDDNAKPHAEELRSYGTVWGSVFTLMTCAVGSGVLALPYAFMLSGVVLSSIILVAMSAMNFYSLHLLVVCAALTQQKTYQDVAFVAFGKIGTIGVQLMLLFALYGSQIGFIVIIGDLLTPVFCTFDAALCDSVYTHRNFLSLMVVVFIITPLAFFPKIHQFQWSSAFAVLSVVFLLCVVIARSVQYIASHPLGHVDLFRWSPMGIAQTTPIMAFALGCHVQVIPVVMALKPSVAQRSGGDKVVFAANTFSTLLYFAFSVGALLEFGDGVDKNILQNYGADKLITAARIVMAIHVSLAFPLLIWPSRNLIDTLIFKSCNTSRTADIIRHIAITIIFIYSAYGFAVLLPNIQIVFGFTGSIAGMLSNYVFPAALYLKIATGESFWRKKLPAAVLVTVGVVNGLASTAVLTYQTIKHQST
eukprot:TRINITY_DN14068_c0_g1_i1.p1 TRINITY_DN14068_c0_g1~~TRINITY_DN14068_c0_g1_i1.p1  ORF type:complete len:433 (+),score=69.93 TRINITY_DN14068_c0_g1_i1:110-1408(+)